MKQLSYIFTIATALFTLKGQAQNTISLDQAISIAMAKNFDIQLSTNNLLIAEQNQDIKNSGYLPSVSASANANYSNNNAYIVTQDGVENNINGIETSSYGASVALNYTLYNGGGRQHQYEKLKAAYELSDVQRKMQIDNTLLDVYTTYYNIAKASIQMEILEESFEISKQRLIRTEYQFGFGQKTSLDVLNAKVDVNNDSLNLVNAQVQLSNSKRQLNFLLGRNIDEAFSVVETIEVNTSLDFNVIQQNMLANNYQAQQIALNKTMSEYDLRINQAAWLPKVTTNVSYGFNVGNNGPASLFATQNTTGLNAGVNLNWNIFDGGATQTKVQNAKIAIENQNIYDAQLNLNLNTELANTWADYTNQLIIMNAEAINVEINTQNFLKTQEQYNLGQITSIDFRQAQLNLINAKYKLINAKFAAKTAEIKLRKLEGKLAA